MYVKATYMTVHNLLIGTCTHIVLVQKHCSTYEQRTARWNHRPCWRRRWWTRPTAAELVYCLTAAVIHTACLAHVPYCCSRVWPQRHCRTRRWRQRLARADYKIERKFLHRNRYLACFFCRPNRNAKNKRIRCLLTWRQALHLSPASRWWSRHTRCWQGKDSGSGESWKSSHCSVQSSQIWFRFWYFRWYAFKHSQRYSTRERHDSRLLRQ